MRHRDRARRADPAGVLLCGCAAVRLYTAPPGRDLRSDGCGLSGGGDGVGDQRGIEWWTIVTARSSVCCEGS